MPYPAILSRRMPYDIDGTEIGERTSSFPGWSVGSADSVWGSGIRSWLTPAERSGMNLSEEWGSKTYETHQRFLLWWFFFPEKREITHLMGLKVQTASVHNYYVKASNDTANGVDGTWENAVFTPPSFEEPSIDLWRRGVFPVSFSEPKKVLVFGVYNSDTAKWHKVHLYGTKAAGETPDDILFLKDGVNEFTALKDWGDRPEGTVDFSSFRVKNASASKSAKNVNIQLNHEDFAISWNEGGPWVTFVDIASLGPGQVSSPIYVRNLLGPPLLILGPKAARVIANVGSWE